MSILLLAWGNLNQYEGSGYVSCFTLRYSLNSLSNPSIADVAAECERLYPVHSLFNFGISLLLTVIIFYLVQFIYYKVILYIVYGSNQEYLQQSR